MSLEKAKAVCRPIVSTEDEEAIFALSAGLWKNTTTLPASPCAGGACPMQPFQREFQPDA